VEISKVPEFTEVAGHRIPQETDIEISMGSAVTFTLQALQNEVQKD